MGDGYWQFLDFLDAPPESCPPYLATLRELILKNWSVLLLSMLSGPDLIKNRDKERPPYCD